MSRVVITGTAGGPRVRVDGCPRCGRPLQLDHTGLIRDGEAYVDLDAVSFAQSLHVSTCAGR